MAIMVTNALHVATRFFLPFHGFRVFSVLQYVYEYVASSEAAREAMWLKSLDRVCHSQQIHWPTLLVVKIRVLSPLPGIPLPIIALNTLSCATVL